MSPTATLQMRCPLTNRATGELCNARLFDYVNRITAGTATVTVKCRKCGEPVTLELAPPSS